MLKWYRTQGLAWPAESQGYSCTRLLFSKHLLPSFNWMAFCHMSHQTFCFSSTQRGEHIIRSEMYAPIGGLGGGHKGEWLGLNTALFTCNACRVLTSRVPLEESAFRLSVWLSVCLPSTGLFPKKAKNETIHVSLLWNMYCSYWRFHNVYFTVTRPLLPLRP